jgi:hypothetical protein
MVLMQNYQFAAAWHKYLTYHLIDLDATHVIVKLAINLLHLQFDKNIDNNYINFYERFVLVHSLYLFKLWHMHFTFNEIKVIIMSPDSDFLITHATKAATHNLVLPHLVCEQHKLCILQRAVHSSHLQPTLSTFDQINTSTSPSFLSLHDALAAADRATNHSDRKSASSPGELDSDNTSTPKVKANCAMCMALKDMGCPFIKFHPESTACPSTNIDMVRTLLVKRPPSFNASKHPSSNLNASSSSSNTTASSVTDNYDSRNQSTSFGSQLNRPKNIPPLPHNFNIYEQCKNCYWSGLDHGQHSAQRRNEW